MYRKIRMLLLLLIFCVVGNYASVRSEIVSVAEPVSTEPMPISEQIEVSINEDGHSGIPAAVEVEELWDNRKEAGLSEEDVDLIALVTMAEAEGESEYVKSFISPINFHPCGTDVWTDAMSWTKYASLSRKNFWNGKTMKLYFLRQASTANMERQCSRKETIISAVMNERRRL